MKHFNAIIFFISHVGSACDACTFGFDGTTCCACGVYVPYRGNWPDLSGSWEFEMNLTFSGDDCYTFQGKNKRPSELLLFCYICETFGRNFLKIVR